MASLQKIERALEVKQTADKVREALPKLDLNYISNNHLFAIVQAIKHLYPQFQPLVAQFNFKNRRKNANITLRQVEDVTGISNSYLSQLENGKIKKASYDTVEKLDDLYKSKGA